MAQMRPVVGDWYRHPNSQPFEVVAIDNDDGTVEIQHYDGAVEEVDFDAWKELPVEGVEPPEDWGAGSFDIEKEDYGVGIDDEPHAVWASPLDYFDAKD